MADRYNMSTFITVRGGAILATAMGALAFIVITFIAEAWESIPDENKADAFVLINASGAHFLFSIFMVAPFVVLARILNGWHMSSASSLASFLYAYWALLIQHKGLTDILLQEEWVSIFPFAGMVLPLLYGQAGEWMFYFLPLIFAWGVGIPALVVLSIFALPGKLMSRR